nr:acetolactate synthase [Aureimonas sp. AU4]
MSATRDAITENYEVIGKYSVKVAPVSDAEEGLLHATRHARSTCPANMPILTDELGSGGHGEKRPLRLRHRSRTFSRLTVVAYSSFGCGEPAEVVAVLSYPSICHRQTPKQVLLSR